MKKQKRDEAPMIHIGASRKSVKEARNAINDILESGAEEETKRAALTALSSMTQVTNTSISGCTLSKGVSK